MDLCLNYTVEQAVVTTFQHSQPIGRTAQTRDLLGFPGAARPDRIELEMGLDQVGAHELLA